VVDDLTPAEVQALRRSCPRFVHGNGYRSAADYLSEIPNETELDFYGDGAVVEELERETAAVLGKPRVRRWR